MTPEELRYFIKIIQAIQLMTAPKMEAGFIEHRENGNLWDMSDEQLDMEIEAELKDLMMFQGEKWRRQIEGRWNGKS